MTSLKKLLAPLLTLALAGLTPLSGACRGSLPGDRCLGSEDCDPPLVCSNRDLPEGSRGVCVPPEALPDAALSADASPL